MYHDHGARGGALRAPELDESSVLLILLLLFFCFFEAQIATSSDSHTWPDMASKLLQNGFQAPLKWLHNRSWRFLKSSWSSLGSLEAAWRPLGSLLERSWEPFGQLWGAIGGVWRVWNALGALRRASWTLWETS